MAEQERGHGRGASVSDAAQRGSTLAPMQEAMPVSPQGTLEPEPTLPPAMVHRESHSEMEQVNE